MGGLIGFRSNTTKSVRYNISTVNPGSKIITPTLFNPFGVSDWTITYKISGAAGLYGDATLTEFKLKQLPTIQPGSNNEIIINGDGITSEKILVFDRVLVPSSSTASIFSTIRIGDTRYKFPITSELFIIEVTFSSAGATVLTGDLWLSGA